MLKSEDQGGCQCRPLVHGKLKTAGAFHGQDASWRAGADNIMVSLRRHNGPLLPHMNCPLAADCMRCKQPFFFDIGEGVWQNTGIRQAVFAQAPLHSQATCGLGPGGIGARRGGTCFRYLHFPAMFSNYGKEIGPTGIGLQAEALARLLQKADYASNASLDGNR